MEPAIQTQTVPRLTALSDEQRRSMGFRTAAELLELMEVGNRIFDVFSVLISKRAEVGTGNTFYPSVVMVCQEGASLKLGDGNIFTPGCFIHAEAGTVRIGSENLFGDGGFTLRTNVKTPLLPSVIEDATSMVLP